MASETGITLSKHWDGERGRMVLVARNGPVEAGPATIEDPYPGGLSGVLCFARPGGEAPRATASGGRITWQLPGLRPGEARELAYTALPQAALNNPAIPRRPLGQDRALLEAAAALRPRLLGGAPEPAPAAGEPEKKGPGRVIAIGAGKGGTGKTTFAIGFATALARLGFRVLLLDADASMGNVAPYLGLKPQATLHDVLAGEAEPEAAVYNVEGLQVVPSGQSIGGFLRMDRNLLADVIGHYARSADYVVVDTPAGYNKEVALALKASDALLLVLNPDEGSMVDGLKLQEMARLLGAEVAGIVLNRCDMKGGRYTKAQVEAHFGTKVIAQVPEDAEARRPGSRAAREIARVASTIAGKGAPPPAEKPFAAKLMGALFR